MVTRKYRWSKHYESAEEELVNILSAKNITAERWTLDQSDAVELHSHTQDTRIWCAEGSITFTVGSQRYSLQPGDALEIPAETPFEAIAGITGCVCFEA